jgi:hypothetical protein
MTRGRVPNPALALYSLSRALPLFLLYPNDNTPLPFPLGTVVPSSPLCGDEMHGRAVPDAD